MDEQQLQLAFIQYLAQQTGALSLEELELIIQQMGEEGLKLAYAEFMLTMQQLQAQYAKHGAQLNYINRLRGVCPEGYTTQYYKKGGLLCKQCVRKEVMQNGGKAKNPVDEFKKSRKKGYPLKEKGGTRYYNDEATRDSVAVNKYNDYVTEGEKPGNWKKGKWIPDRSKYRK